MKFILVIFCFVLMSCDRTVVVPEDIPAEEPTGYCFDYDKSTVQCYLKGKVCYLYFDSLGNHVICSSR